jgi:hypothetical protein
MKIGKRLSVLVAAAALLAGVSTTALAQPRDDAATITIGEKDIGGVVSSPQGREAGVWVIAETTELPTQFRRIVVTDDQGRYLVPDLPPADYSVWVRGYGLIDSPKMRAKPGQRLDLAAAPAPSAADAAHYYPAIYWYSLLTIPDKKEFGGENGIPANVTQQDWLTIVKNRSCVGCHQLDILREGKTRISLADPRSGAQTHWWGERGGPVPNSGLAFEVALPDRRASFSSSVSSMPTSFVGIAQQR